MLAFTFTLTSDELGDEFDGVDLNQFGMQHMVKQRESHFTIRPPKPGVYQLVIYVKVVLSVLKKVLASMEMLLLVCDVSYIIVMTVY